MPHVDATAYQRWMKCLAIQTNIALNNIIQYWVIISRNISKAAYICFFFHFLCPLMQIQMYNAIKKLKSTICTKLDQSSWDNKLRFQENHICLCPVWHLIISALYIYIWLSYLQGPLVVLYFQDKTILPCWFLFFKGEYNVRCQVWHVSNRPEVE